MSSRRKKIHKKRPLPDAPTALVVRNNQEPCRGFPVTVLTDRTEPPVIKLGSIKDVFKSLSKAFREEENKEPDDDDDDDDMNRMN